MLEFEMMYGRLEENELKGTPEENFSYILGLFSDCITENHMGAERAAVVTDSETGEIVATSEMFVSAIVCYDDSEANRVLSHTENSASAKPVRLDVSALAGELYEKYRPEAESRNISYKSEGECVMNADKALTSQALENLITNAVKFTPNGGSITVKASAGSIAVTNTAVNTEKLETLDLEAPFVKGDESRTNRSGTGLGLSIAKTACERQGFKLKISLGESSFTAEIKFRK